MRADFIPTKKHAPQHLGKVLVLGLGKSGRAVVEYCLPLLKTRVTSLSIAGGDLSDASAAFAQQAQAQGAHVAFGSQAVQALATEAAVSSFDLCIASPGIPFYDPLYVEGALRSTELIAELEFAWRESDASSRWVAVTGTNGKTTVTACVVHLLRAHKMKAVAVGNIGKTCIETVSNKTAQVYVAEASSYQLASTRTFAPEVAVVLNITPDHLHWHKTFEAYCEAKFKVLANLSTTKNAVAILDATNNIVRTRVRLLHRMSLHQRGFAYLPLGTAQGLGGNMHELCGSEHAAFIGAKGTLNVIFGGTKHKVGTTRTLHIKGWHNASNALVAASVAVVLGVSDHVIARALGTFLPLEHRIEKCGVINGVECYNDSKATNVDAAMTALDSFPEQGITVLLGGADKGTDLSPLLAKAHQAARNVVCFGDAGARIYQAFEAVAAKAPSAFRLVQAARLEDALDIALSLSKPGEVVLLSPACASFDEFSCFEERGSVFKSLVNFRQQHAGQ